MPAAPLNIVLIMTDQQRADFFAGEGFGLDTMPFVESLGRRGVRFARAYTPNPTCAPARCAMLTGRFPKATHVRENGGVKNIFRTPDIPSLFHAAGYGVNLAGKNHTYLADGDFDYASYYMHTGGGRKVVHGTVTPDARSDQERQFDEYLEGLDHGVAAKPAPFPLECQQPYRIVRDAIECVETRDQDRPFFIWLSFPEPHNPYQVPEPYFSLFAEAQVPPPAASAEDGAAKGDKWRWMQNLIAEKRPGYLEQWRRYRANYCGMIRLIDDQVRRFVEYLESRHLLDTTLVVFVSDHGDYAGDYGLQRKGVGMPECLVRVPMLACGPGIKPQNAPRQEFVSLVDLLPTFCDACGIEIPYGVQGRSLWPMLSGGEVDLAAFDSIYAELGFGGAHYKEHDRPPLHFSYEGPTFDELNSVTQSGKLKMLRMDDWKLLFDMDGRGELYHLPDDPMELNNRYDDPDCRAVRLRMTEALLRWTIRTEDDLPTAKYLPRRGQDGLSGV